MPNQEIENSSESFYKEIIKFAFLVVVTVLPIRLFVASPFLVSGLSMVPTFQNSDYLIVDRITYDFKKPARGDVIIFHYPKDTSKYFIKRVIGLPGDKVSINGSVVTILNKEHPEGFTIDQSYIPKPDSGEYSVEIPEGEYFVMGDNRSQSSDSRIWGNVPEENIVGRALVRLFPFNKINLLPGEHNLNN